MRTPEKPCSNLPHCVFNPPKFNAQIPRRMFQIVFNKISAAEMSEMPKELQLDLLMEFQVLPKDLDNLEGEHFGMVERDGKKLLRYRAKDYRIYFEKSEEGLVIHRVLHKNTIRDFLFRASLPMGEDEQLGQTGAFWELIEEGRRAKG